MRADTAFLDDLSSPSPIPGGGGACAYCGALAAALAQMVANLSAHNPNRPQARAQEVYDGLMAHRKRLVQLIDEDANAFRPLSEAYKMPHDTEEQTAARARSVQVALVGACETPLEIMDECKQIIDLCDDAAEIGSHMALPDVGAAAILAEAALRGASLDVYINAHALDDRDRAQGFTDKADALAAGIDGHADAIYDRVMGEVR